MPREVSMLLLLESSGYQYQEGIEHPEQHFLVGVIQVI
jgi:hypothetical protein